MSQGLPIALDASENVPETPGEPSTKTEVTLPPKTGPTTTTGGPRPPKTTTEIVKEGGIGAIKAVDEVVKGLNGLFGDPNTLRFGPAFDEETYQKAKPQFVNAWNGVKDVGYPRRASREYLNINKEH